MIVYCGKRWVKVRFWLMTIAAMLHWVSHPVLRLDATLGLPFAHSGVLNPFFGTLLGWTGVALIGSDRGVQRAFPAAARALSAVDWLDIDSTLPSDPAFDRASEEKFTPLRQRILQSEQEATSG